MLTVPFRIAKIVLKKWGFSIKMMMLENILQGSTKYVST